MKTIVKTLVLSLLITTIYSCNKDDDSTTTIATSIEIVSGDNQSGLRETTLTNPIEIIVKNQNGNPFAGATINFSVNEGSISTNTTTTDDDGKATVFWTLGVTEGNQNLIVNTFKSDGITPITGSPITVTATSLRPIILGEFYQGGVVFFVDDSSIHGLVCTIESIGDYTWGCPGTEINGADDLEIGGGQQNTIDILNDCSESQIAARKCDELVLNGFNDWFLPSKLELNTMAIKKDLISATSTGNGGTALDGHYWSSSEFSSNAALRRNIDGVAVSFNVIGKDASGKVRAIRAF